MFADDSSVKPTQIDGYPPGTLTSFSIGADGILTGVYSNGRQQPLGMVGLAVFDNAGLQKAGSNLFIQARTQAILQSIQARLRGFWKPKSRNFEMSNVVWHSNLLK